MSEHAATVGIVTPEWSSVGIDGYDWSLKACLSISLPAGSQKNKTKQTNMLFSMYHMCMCATRYWLLLQWLQHYTCTSIIWCATFDCTVAGCTERKKFFKGSGPSLHHKLHCTICLILISTLLQGIKNVYIDWLHGYYDSFFIWGLTCQFQTAIFVPAQTHFYPGSSP